MTTTRGGKVTYTDNPRPHPEAGDAPRTGVPTNPVQSKVQTSVQGKSAKEWMKETD